MNRPANVVELLQALIRIPSVNPEGDPGTELGGEARCAEFIADFLEDLGAHTQLDEVEHDRPNVIGRFPSPNKPGKRVIFAPHTDTVSVSGMTIDPFAAEVRDEKVWGRGASDTKGSIAAMLWALKESKDTLSERQHEVWFAGLMGEEAGQHGAHAFAKSLADTTSPDVQTFAIVGEPTELDIVHTHKGSVWIKVTARGKAAHSSTPERGDNAIYKISDVIRYVRDELAPEFARLRDPFLGSPTVSVGTCSGGTKINIVPDYCETQIDVRTIPAQMTTEFADQLSERLRNVCPGLEVSCWQAKPLFIDPAHPMIAKLERAGGKCVGAPWFSDAGVFAEAGIPAVAAGPGSIAQAHTEDEWISVEQLQRGVDFFRRFLEQL
jgi:acetylornithine deacetylase/succinyl-diaminopimelate desuccinylase-like protein